MRDCYYLYWCYHATDVVDCAYCEDTELCYECVDCMRCYNCNFCQDCKDCSDLILCYDCVGCKNCFGCTGLVNKEFYAFNERQTPENYKKISDGRLSDEVFKKYKNEKNKIPRRDFILKCENCVGNHVENSENCFFVFDAVRSRDCIYNFNGYENINSADCSFTKAELGYENLGGGWNFNCNYILFCSNCTDCQFCNQCRDCKNCFGCDGLRHKQYYILNEPYSREDYEKKVADVWNELKSSQNSGDLMAIFDDVEFEGIIH